MARRPYDDQHEYKRNIFWWLFCMPGAVIMWFEYMFPGRGQVYATGRRHENVLVQFIYTMLLYGLAFFLLIWFPANRQQRLVESVPAAVAQTDSEPLAEEPERVTVRLPAVEEPVATPVPETDKPPENEDGSQPIEATPVELLSSGNALTSSAMDFPSEPTNLEEAPIVE